MPVEHDTLMRLKGIYRHMLYEYWQSLHITNTHQLTSTQIESEPHSIRMMEWLLYEKSTAGGLGQANWYVELADDYNNGRRV